jgi:hypothetical protein
MRIESMELTRMPQRDVNVAIAVYQKDGNLCVSHHAGGRGVLKVQTVTASAYN